VENPQRTNEETCQSFLNRVLETQFHRNIHGFFKANKKRTEEREGERKSEREGGRRFQNGGLLTQNGPFYWK
jgi:hypothetical protein